MELKTAIEILEYHQEWRLGKREDMIHEPKKLTEALDVALLELKKKTQYSIVKTEQLQKIITENTVFFNALNVEKAHQTFNGNIGG